MKQITTALSAFGMSGRVFHAPFIFTHPGFHLHGILERNKKEASSIYTGIISYDNYDQLLDDDAIELVIINTPIGSHFDFAKRALEAGKNVLVEKAFTVSLKEAEELFRLAEENQLKITVYQNRRYDSDFQTVKEMISSRILGDIVEAELHYDRFNPKLSAKLHKEQPVPGAGIVHDLGPHLIDQAVKLFGKPDHVFADLQILRPGSEVVDNMDVLFYYDKKRVRLKAGYYVKEPVPAYIIHGTEGSFHKQRSDIQEKDLMAGKFPNLNDWGIEPKSAEGILHVTKGSRDEKHLIPAMKGNYMKFFDELYAALRENNSLPVTKDEALLVMQLVEKIFESNEKKQVVPLP